MNCVGLDLKGLFLFLKIFIRATVFLVLPMIVELGEHRGFGSTSEAYMANFSSVFAVADSNNKIYSRHRTRKTAERIAKDKSCKNGRRFKVIDLSKLSVMERLALLY